MFVDMINANVDKKIFFLLIQLVKKKMSFESFTSLSQLENKRIENR